MNHDLQCLPGARREVVWSTRFWEKATVIDVPLVAFKRALCIILDCAPATLGSFDAYFNKGQKQHLFVLPGALMLQLRLLGALPRETAIEEQLLFINNNRTTDNGTYGTSHLAVKMRSALIWEGNLATQAVEG